jgi:hypothetical protein
MTLRPVRLVSLLHTLRLEEDLSIDVRREQLASLECVCIKVGCTGVVYTENEKIF